MDHAAIYVKLQLRSGVNCGNTFLPLLRFGSILVEIGVLHGEGKVYDKSKCSAFFGSGQAMLRRWQRHYFRRLLDREKASFEKYAI